MKWFSMMVLLLVICLTGCRATRDGDFHTTSGAASVDAQRSVAYSCQEACLDGQIKGLRNSGIPVAITVVNTNRNAPRDQDDRWPSSLFLIHTA